MRPPEPSRPESPSPEAIREARKAAKLTLSEAAWLVFVTRRGWEGWEYGKRRMPWGLWLLFLLRTNQHPTAKLLGHDGPL